MRWGPGKRTIRGDPKAVFQHIHHAAMVRRVVVQFSTVPFVHNVEEACHENVLKDADDIVGGTVSRPAMTQPRSEIEQDVDA